jgi:hypothetical protein
MAAFSASGKEALSRLLLSKQELYGIIGREQVMIIKFRKIPAFLAEKNFVLNWGSLCLQLIGSSNRY